MRRKRGGAGYSRWDCTLCYSNGFGLGGVAQRFEGEMWQKIYRKFRGKKGQKFEENLICDSSSKSKNDNSEKIKFESDFNDEKIIALNDTEMDDSDVNSEKENSSEECESELEGTFNDFNVTSTTITFRDTNRYIRMHRRRTTPKDTKNSVLLSSNTFTYDEDSFKKTSKEMEELINKHDVIVQPADGENFLSNHLISDDIINLKKMIKDTKLPNIPKTCLFKSEHLKNSDGQKDMLNSVHYNYQYNEGERDSQTLEFSKRIHGTFSLERKRLVQAEAPDYQFKQYAETNQKKRVGIFPALHKAVLFHNVAEDKSFLLRNGQFRESLSLNSIRHQVSDTDQEQPAEP